MKAQYIIQKEIRESILTPKGFLWYVFTSVILSILSYFFLTNNELSLLDQSQMLYMIMNFITVLGVLMGLVLGADVFAGEIERGTLEALFLSPVTKIGKAGRGDGKLVDYLRHLSALSIHRRQRGAKSPAGYSLSRHPRNTAIAHLLCLFHGIVSENKVHEKFPDYLLLYFPLSRLPCLPFSSPAHDMVWQNPRSGKSLC